MAKEFLSDLNIHGAGQIQFKTAAGANAGKIDQDGNNLVLTNAVGDVLLGDGSSDVFIGDGTNNVDIIFEQSGSIKGDGSAVTLTLGGANTTLNLENPNINGALSLSNKLTFTSANGYILFDYEPATGSNAEYSSEVPLLKVDRAGTELTVMSRLTNNGALAIGIDDTVAIVAGDTKAVVKDNINYTGEKVVFASESGFIAYGFPDNNTSWANRNVFQFRSDSAAAGDNGLYIGDGGQTQFIDLQRNLLNIADITLTGNITFDDGSITSDGTTFAFDGASGREVLISSARDVRIVIDDNDDDTDNQFEVYKHSVSNANRLLRMDQSGNMDIAGSFTASGYNDSNWNTAYNNSITAAAFSGTTTKTLTLTQQDGGTITAQFTDQAGSTGTTINNNANNRVITGSGTANTLEAESGLTFNNSDSDGLSIGGGSVNAMLQLHTKDSSMSTRQADILFHVDGSDVSRLRFNNNVSGIATNTLTYNVGANPKFYLYADGNAQTVGYMTSTRFRDADDTTYLLNPAGTDTVLNQVSFGVPGGGSNTKSRYLSIEGNADGSGEGSGRIFFTEHNSSTTSMSKYGMSIGYRGGNNTITGTDGNTWTGLQDIGNGQWGMWGHNNSANGSLIMYGDRAATFVDFLGNDIKQAVLTSNVTGGSGLNAVSYTNLTNVPSSFAPSQHTQNFSTITNTPTTLAGYGITDAAPSSTTTTANNALPKSGGTMTGDIVMQDEMVNFAAGNPELPNFRGKRSNTRLNDRDWDTEGAWSYTTFENSTTDRPRNGLHNGNGLLTFNTHSGDGTNNYMHQMAFCTSPGTLHHRNRSGGSWNSWYEIAQTGRDLTGDLRPTKLYSAGNTDYYLDPASSSQLNTLRLDGVEASNIDFLQLHNRSNGAGVQIKFSDQNQTFGAANCQHGTITFYHSDGASYGSGATFILKSDQPTTTILADGKLMYNEGIYSKPSSGTGAGTRKDSNWDAAYTHSQSAHAPSNADATPSWVPSSDPGYLTSSSPVPAHNQAISTITNLQSSLDNKTGLNDIRSLGVQAFTGGTNPNITTAQLISEIETDGGFDSYSSVFKTSWSYAGNYNLNDAGRFTETAGTSWITWTDNSSDTTRGNITALAIAPNTGGSAGKVFIYNDQGNSYAPGWREVWTNTSDGSGSGLDADKLDGQEGSHYLAYSNLTGVPSSFTPAQHTQGISTITGLQTALDSKLPKSGGTMTGNLLMNNLNITGVNVLTFNDPGPNEGISWSGGNTKIYESPDNLTSNSAGNLQFVYGSTRRLTVNNTGIDVNGNIVVSGTVDGRDIATDGTKLDTIATNADVTPSWVPSSNPNYLTSSSPVPSHNQAFSTITSTPTTLSGYGITDAATSAQGAKADAALPKAGGVMNNGATITFPTSAGSQRGFIKATDTNDEHFIIATSGGEDIAFKDGGTSGTTNLISRGDGNLWVRGAIQNGTIAYSQVTGTPSSLPASGGNSDTVDNLHASSFLRSDASDTATGDLTLSGRLKVSSLVSNSLIGYHAGTTASTYKQKYGTLAVDVDGKVGIAEKEITFSIEGNGWINRHSNPVKILDAPGADKMIVVQEINILIQYSAPIGIGSQGICRTTDNTAYMIGFFQGSGTNGNFTVTGVMPRNTMQNTTTTNNRILNRDVPVEGTKHYPNKALYWKTTRDAPINLPTTHPGAQHIVKVKYRILDVSTEFENAYDSSTNINSTSVTSISQAY